MKNICNTRKNGLSPLARGTQYPAFWGRESSRFIPAGAGNTPRQYFWGYQSPVYPRWRGEHLPWYSLVLYQSGLSPLARGTRLYVPRSEGKGRFIPAGAGNTTLRRPVATSVTVYPRWRGEHSKHNLLLINDFLSQSQSTNFIVSHKQHIHYVKEHLIH